MRCTMPELVLVAWTAVAAGCGSRASETAASRGSPEPTGNGGEGGAASGAGGEVVVGGDGAGGCGDAPVAAPEGVWTFVPVEGTVCATPGTSAGFYVNPSANSGRLVIFFQGGGACFNEADCEAANLNGFDPAQQKETLASGKPGVFDRSDPDNPFADFDYVNVPYCTGDLHAGDRVSSYGMQHRGYANFQVYLEHIRATFCDATRVVVTGGSAGGFGSTVHYDGIHRAFGDIPVDLVADSGPFLRPEYMPEEVQAMLDDNWGLRANLPGGCSDCSRGWHEIYPYLAATWPADRLSLLSFLRDPSIQERFAPYTPFDPIAVDDDASDFQPAIEDLADGVLAPTANFRVFLVDRKQHVVMGSGFGTPLVGTATVGAFLEAQLEDDPEWVDVRP